MVKRKRNSFFFFVSNVIGTYELQVGYKTSKGDIQPLSTSKPRAPVKIPFGPPTECEFRVRTETGKEEPVTEFKFVNKRKQSVALKDCLLNNVEMGLSNFSRKITALTVEGKKKLLGLYLSLLNFSVDFTHHRESVHDSKGFVLNGGGVNIKDLQDAGGSVEDYDQFVDFAKESAPADIAVSSDKALEELAARIQSSKKRKATTNVEEERNPKERKLSKSDIVMKKEKQELEDELGLEKAYQSSFCGVAHIPLDNISVCPQMQLKINPFRVSYIKTSMKKRYNPSLSVLVVCPVDDGKKFDVEKDHFFVVQKVKCLVAFKELDKSGEFTGLSGHESRKVLCFVLASNKAEVMQYANLTENYISGQFATKTVPQDILHHFHCLSIKDTNIKALKVVERMNSICCIRGEECTALERLCKWSGEGFKVFMEVLAKYEAYQTTDVKCAAGHRERIARGLKLNLPNVLLRSLGKVTEKFFVENSSKVLDKTLSLKELSESYLELVEIEKALKVLSKIADYVPVDTIQSLHPGRFNTEKMKDFIGAVYDNKIKNQKASELERYYEFVISHQGDEMYVKPVEFTTYASVDNVFEDEEKLESCDMIVYNMKTLHTETINNIFNMVLGGEKIFHVALLLFPSEKDYFSVISYLRKQQSVTSMIKNFQILPLLFNSQVSKAGMGTKIIENIQHGLLLGSFVVLKSPLMVHYSDIAHATKVLRAICPTNAKVGVVSAPGLPPLKLHTQEMEWNVHYFGTQSDLAKFKKTLSADKTPVGSNNEEDLEVDNIEDQKSFDDGGPSTSTTPSKSSEGPVRHTPLKLSPVKLSPVLSLTPMKQSALSPGLDDSGYIESTPQSSKSSRSLDFTSDHSVKQNESEN